MNINCVVVMCSMRVWSGNCLTLAIWRCIVLPCSYYFFSFALIFVYCDFLYSKNAGPLKYTVVISIVMCFMYWTLIKCETLYLNLHILSLLVLTIALRSWRNLNWVHVETQVVCLESLLQAYTILCGKMK